jgi:hypothetical protein
MKGTAKSYSIPARACITGSVLRKIAGSTCAGCYAFTGSYNWSTTQRALETRLELLTANLENGAWIAGMVFLIGKKADNFRWLDSGDLQSLLMLEAIAEIARRLPSCRFWLPTREKAIVRDYLKNNVKPENLTIRFSAAMVDAKRAPDFDCTSTVHNKSAPIGYTCPATIAGNSPNCKANNCRACWNPSIANISYQFH